MKSLVILCLVLFSFYCTPLQTESSILPFKKTYVNLTNDLPDRQNLSVHCKSKDDDLGVQQLLPQGSYGFRFRPTYFGGTRFYCSFGWGIQLHHYDVYIQSRDKERCEKLCHWLIRPDGPCLSLPKETNPYCYPWNNNNNQN